MMLLQHLPGQGHPALMLDSSHLLPHLRCSLLHVVQIQEHSSPPQQCLK